ncbi:MAG: penicillin-binding protein activator LpoB [Candidatus Lambdaproteobacteria bacterium]|nr:penicillin-binding protein activator LpoB [Candidatus Lambdaproteobacteria bacterium]
MVVVAALALASCAERRVQRRDVKEEIDLSGRWNDTDSRLVADEMIKDVLSFPWVQQFKDGHAGKKPVVIPFGVKNRTSEHINTQTFVKDLERSFLRSGAVQVVASRDERESIRAERADQQAGLTANPAAIGKETGADFVLTGVINAINDREGGQEVVFYQTNLELISVVSNEKVWIGDKKIKKFIDRSKTKF